LECDRRATNRSIAYGIDSIAVVKLNVVFGGTLSELGKDRSVRVSKVLNELCDFVLEQESVSPRSLSVARSPRGSAAGPV